MQEGESMPWFHGPLSRGQVDELLRGSPLGSFLVRSSTTRPGDYVLCVRESNMVKHYIIEKKSDSEYEIGSQPFPGLLSVIDFYKIHVLDTTVLTGAVEVETETKETEENETEKKETSTPPNNNSNSNTAYKPNTAESKMKVMMRVIALYDFNARDEEDLPFTKNEILDVIGMQEANWWTGRNSKGAVGAVPAPYLRPLPEEESEKLPVMAKAICDRPRNPYDPTALSYQSGDIIKVLEKSDTGLWTGELKGHTGKFPFTQVVLLSELDGSNDTWESFTN
ncbi:Crk-like protein [Trichoplax sp. H2]|nr:Crk-like protein [Trichoplax sp. H2]|eukprot:RDD44999.1 Crk-like protein [Trichoplax sp. H2]